MKAPDRPSWCPRLASGTLSILVFVVLTTGSIARTAEIEGVSFPERIDVGGTSLTLNGLGLLRYRILFRGYVGGLYLPADAKANEVLADVPKALELHYFWKIDAALFGEAADEHLARNHAPEEITRLRTRLDRLHALYRDVEVGDRYRLTYVPGVGTTLAYNGKALGTIPGADFARAYFAIWLGPDPLDASFRNQLLGDG